MIPKFSVIVPVHNAAPYLAQCIQSVLSQSVGDFELLLVDDASTDCSAEIMERYAAHDNRIRLFASNGGTPSVPRNLALDNARGEWVIFLDADDYLLPGSLAVYSRGMEKFPEADYIHGREMIEDKGQLSPSVLAPARQHIANQLVNGGGYFIGTQYSIRPLGFCHAPRFN